MNEIERAIERFRESLEDMMYENYPIETIEDTQAALTALEEKLSRQENAPLTWDEVVVSEGKPVFIYGLEGEHGDDGWSIVGEKYERSGFTFVNLHDKNITNCGLDDLYGKTWLAYRYEPKGEDTP